MLKLSHTNGLTEAGCDEAGRGCLAGPVFAAAVILPPDFRNELLTDSKQLTPRQRDLLRGIIEQDAMAWSVEMTGAEEIDRINILNASILTMHKAVARLSHKPELLLIDGNRFKPVAGIPHCCIIRGDAIYMSIAAASILAKTYRDEFMTKLHENYPQYGWNRNKGYPTLQHRKAILASGLSPYHRRSFRSGAEKLF
jgi:ribonuclease HII